jgi:hypothetical protein
MKAIDRHFRKIKYPPKIPGTNPPQPLPPLDIVVLDL